MLCICNQRMYLLKQLKSQGLQLHIVFTALIVSRLLYALPAWGGFWSSVLLNKIDSILRKAHKFGYTTEVLNVMVWICCKTQIISSFRLYSEYGHCLHTLLLDLRMIDIVLRSSGTSFNLPQCNYKLYKRSFVEKCLFGDCIGMFCCVLHFVFHIFIPISYYFI